MKWSRVKFKVDYLMKVFLTQYSRYSTVFMSGLLCGIFCIYCRKMRLDWIPWEYLMNYFPFFCFCNTVCTMDHTKNFYMISVYSVMNIRYTYILHGTVMYAQPKPLFIMEFSKWNIFAYIEYGIVWALQCLV